MYHPAKRGLRVDDNNRGEIPSPPAEGPTFCGMVSRSVHPLHLQNEASSSPELLNLRVWFGRRIVSHASPLAHVKLMWLKPLSSLNIDES